MSLTLHMADKTASDRLSDEAYSKQIAQMANRIQEAEALVIGIGSGLSSAAGHNHYHTSPKFRQAFAPFVDYYGFKSMMDGYYHLYSNYEEQWAYYFSYASYMLNAPVGKPYLDLLNVIKKRTDEACPAFIISTNVDTQTERACKQVLGNAFAQDNLCLFQGSFAFLQCSQPCHDQLYPIEPFIKNAQIEKIFAAYEDSLFNEDILFDTLHNSTQSDNFAPKIDTEAVPRCPECGRIMVPWVRDNEFLQGKIWKESVERYHDFLNTHANDTVLFLELGVGDMTPGIIKMPFWDMTYRWEKAHLISIDFAKDSAPAHLAGKCLASNMELSAAMSALAQEFGV